MGTFEQVRIVGLEVVETFAKKYPDSRPGLAHWRQAVEAANWKSTADLREQFGAADFVGDKVVFNIGGRKYRLIAVITYLVRVVSVEHVLTHKEYDKGRWKER